MPKRVVQRDNAAAGIVSLKVTLRGVKPPIWRRMLMPRTMTLANLHQAIQAVMGWYDCHLHVFEIAGRRYRDPRIADDFDEEDIADENQLTLNSLLKSGIVRFAYTYDLGDNWEHIVEIENTQPFVDGRSYPSCVAGKRNCPPEDCGGPWGYQHLIDVLADPAHPERAERIEWIGEDFDPDEFDIEDTNAMLASAFLRE